MNGASEGRSRVWWYAVVTAIAIAVAFFAVRGCAFMPWNRDAESITVRLTVTRGLGSEVLRDESIELRKGASAMQALQEVAEVETSYGGGFIYAVDGLVSGFDGEDSRKTDWFYYINGQMAEVGAEDLEVADGDWLLFDYHSWEYSMFTPAFAGCFPEPFVHGYREPPRECLVLFAPGWEEAGEELAGWLRKAGAPSCRTEGLSAEWRPREGEYAIVLGTIDELMINPFLADANENASRLGLSVFLGEEGLMMVDETGEVEETLSSGAGCVEAIGSRLGEEDSALMITGTDAAGVEAALALLEDWDSTRANPVMVIVTGTDRGVADEPAG